MSIDWWKLKIFEKDSEMNVNSILLLCDLVALVQEAFHIY